MNDAELEKAIVNYRMECDLYLSDREQGAYTQEEYENSINYALDKLMKLIKDRDTKMLEYVLLLDSNALQDIGIKVDMHHSHLPAYREIVKEQQRRFKQWQESAQ
jgi:hypothetical protein